MSFWQDLIAVALVAAAAIYVLWRLRRVGRGRPSCGSGPCPGCGASPEQTPLVTLDPPHEP